MKLEYLGANGYRGYDGKSTIVAQKGQVVDVSEAKARQLMTDFPGHWLPSEKAATSAPVETPKAEVSEKPAASETPAVKASETAPKKKLKVKRK